MKNYRAVVIDGRKVIKRGLAVIVVGIVAITMLGNIYTTKKWTEQGTTNIKSIINESIPVFSGMKNTDIETHLTLQQFFRKVLATLCTFDPYDRASIFANEIPLMNVVGNSYLARTGRYGAVEAYNPDNADLGEGNPEPNMPKSGEYPIKAIDSSQAKALGESNAKILIRNETNYSIDVETMLNSKLTFDMKGEGPKILIVHTHATECYSEEGAVSYSPDKSDRTLDVEKNVVAVGEKMKQIFEANGIETIHDTTLHDHPNFNGSYANSLKTVEMYKAKYPSIKVVLDVHRDAYVYDDGSKAKFVTKIGEKNAAQLMLVVGTNAGGLEHPEWRENMKLALKIQQHISKKYPTLMRGVNLRKERFNGHTTKGSLIIEVGSSGNNMSEAINGASYAAEEIAKFLKEQ